MPPSGGGKPRRLHCFGLRGRGDGTAARVRGREGVRGRPSPCRARGTAGPVSRQERLRPARLTSRRVRVPRSAQALRGRRLRGTELRSEPQASPRRRQGHGHRVPRTACGFPFPTREVATTALIRASQGARVGGRGPRWRGHLADACGDGAVLAQVGAQNRAGRASPAASGTVTGLQVPSGPEAPADGDLRAPGPPPGCPPGCPPVLRHQELRAETHRARESLRHRVVPSAATCWETLLLGPGDEHTRSFLRMKNVTVQEGPSVQARLSHHGQSLCLRRPRA